MIPLQDVNIYIYMYIYVYMPDTIPGLLAPLGRCWYRVYMVHKYILPTYFGCIFYRYLLCWRIGSFCSNSTDTFQSPCHEGTWPPRMMLESPCPHQHKVIWQYCAYKGPLDSWMQKSYSPVGCKPWLWHTCIIMIWSQTFPSKDPSVSRRGDISCQWLHGCKVVVRVCWYILV